MLNPYSSPHLISLWASQAQLDPTETDCVTTVMLKILDGKCKMYPEEKKSITIVYDAIKGKTGHVLDPEIHRLISEARYDMNDDMVMRIYEQRLLAETQIGRPTMKGFKARLRKEGIIGYEIEKIARKP